MLQSALYAVGITFQACREPSARMRLVGVLICIQILDSWPSNRPFWWLGQLDAELVQIVDQKCIGARFVIECGRTRSGSFLDPLQQAELTAPAWEFVSGYFSLHNRSAHSARPIQRKAGIMGTFFVFRAWSFGIWPFGLLAFDLLVFWYFGTLGSLVFWSFGLWSFDLLFGLLMFWYLGIMVFLSFGLLVF